MFVQDPKEEGTDLGWQVPQIDTVKGLSSFLKNKTFNRFQFIIYGIGISFFFWSLGGLFGGDLLSFVYPGSDIYNNFVPVFIIGVLLISYTTYKRYRDFTKNWIAVSIAILFLLLKIVSIFVHKQYGYDLSLFNTSHISITSIILILAAIIPGRKLE